MAQEHVVGLDVAVRHPALLVEETERQEELARIGQHLREGLPPCVAQAEAEGLEGHAEVWTVHEGVQERDEVPAALLNDIDTH